MIYLYLHDAEESKPESRGVFDRAYDIIYIFCKCVGRCPHRYGNIYTTGGAPRWPSVAWCNRFITGLVSTVSSIKVSFWGSRTLKIVILVENHPYSALAHTVCRVITARSTLSTTP